MLAYWRLLRPSQWVKNFFIFLPLFFSLQISNVELLSKTILTFGLFCLVASAVYIFNDWQDREEDRVHPQKKYRPLASGEVSTRTAFILMGILVLVSFVGAYLLNLQLLGVLFFYWAMNIAYSARLKHYSLVDIFIITLGFILRIFAGAVVINNRPSMWLILITFLLALFLALAKRRDDVILSASGAKTRRIIAAYNVEFLNTSLAIMAAVTIVSYIFYCISPEVEARFHNENLYFTVIFVVMGIMRYLQLTLVYGKSGDPTKMLLKDLFLQLIIVAWAGLFMFLIYFQDVT